MHLRKTVTGPQDRLNYPGQIPPLITLLRFASMNRHKATKSRRACRPRQTNPVKPTTTAKTRRPVRNSPPRHGRPENLHLRGLKIAWQRDIAFPDVIHFRNLYYLSMYLRVSEFIVAYRRVDRTPPIRPISRPVIEITNYVGISLLSQNSIEILSVIDRSI